MRPSSTITAAGRTPSGVTTRLETTACVILRIFGQPCGECKRNRQRGMNMQTEKDFMQLAIRLATENVRSGQGGPFGAVVVRSGEVIATGANRVTTANDPTAHAEINAI